jgi:hypothetical protein
MVATIADALSQVKADLPRMIEQHVLAYLREHKDRPWRQRLLDPLTTTQLFIAQVMHGNTAINHLRHLSGMTCTATAYCKARARLPLELLRAVSDGVTRQLLPESDEACRWRGHRVWQGDGTSFSMPDEPPLQAHFGQPGRQRPGCGFPVASLLVLCNQAGFIAKTLAVPLRTHDASRVAQLHEQLEPGDVLVYDRAGCSYAHLALLSQRNLHAIVRMHQKQIVSFRPGRTHQAQRGKGRRTGQPTSQWIKRLGRRDQLVRWFKPQDKPRWMSRRQYDALPDSIVVRELRYAVNHKGFRSRVITLVTTLLDPREYPAAELAEQFRRRWEIETNFGHLKTTMGMDVLKCKTVEGVLKELAVFVLVYNLVRLVMLRAAQRQKVPPGRVSFVDAWRWLRDAGDAGQVIDLIVNPARPGRVEPRVIKRRKDRYTYMTKPRDELRKALAITKFAA